MKQIDFCADCQAKTMGCNSRGGARPFDEFAFYDREDVERCLRCGDFDMLPGDEVCQSCQRELQADKEA